MLRGSLISDGWWRHFLQRHPKLSVRSEVLLGMLEIMQ